MKFVHATVTLTQYHNYWEKSREPIRRACDTPLCVQESLVQASSGEARKGMQLCAGWAQRVGFRSLRSREGSGQRGESSH
jgi:hypothetical protein